MRGVEYVLIAALLIASGLVSAFITFTVAVRGDEIAVPNLVGTPLSDAGPLLADAELSLRHEGNRFDAEIPVDLIVYQTPAPSTPTLSAIRFANRLVMSIYFSVIRVKTRLNRS